MPQPSLFFFILTTGRRCNLPSLKPVCSGFRREHGAELAALSFCSATPTAAACPAMLFMSQQGVVPCNFTPGWFGRKGPLPLLHNRVSEIVKSNLDQTGCLVSIFIAPPSPPLLLLQIPRCLCRLEPTHVSRWPATTNCYWSTSPF